MTSAPHALPADPALPLCDVLEQEYAEIFHAPLPPSPSGWFDSADILDPERLTERLLCGKDRAARGLREQELARVVADLHPLYAAKAWTEIRQMLAVGLNSLLWDPQLYNPGDRTGVKRFAGIRFRTQTLDQIDRGYSIERNRLILEDAFFELAKVYDQRLEAMYQRIHEMKPSALCFSGGGIRSATFGLGVVQGLARHGVLDQFNYLSTVSGGGYLGGWLSAWIARTGSPHVIEQLARPPSRPLEPEPTPIWHLRTYSNYLSPRLGLLSADTWTLVATYLRNLWLGWLVLLPVLVAALSTPVLLLAVARWHGESTEWQQRLCWVIGALGLACGVLAVRYVHSNRPVSEGRAEGTGLIDHKRSQRDFLAWCLVPLCGAALAATTCWAWIARGVDPGVETGWKTFAGIGVGVHAAGWLLSTHHRRVAEAIWRFAARLGLELVFILGVGGAAGAVVWVVAERSEPLLRYSPLGPALYVWLAVPLLLALILLFNDLYVGYASRGQVDAAREWSARFNAWVLIVIGGWLGGAGLVIMGPIGLTALFQYLWPAHAESAVTTAKAVGAAIGAISGFVTVLQGKSEKTAGSTASGKAPMTLALTLAAPTFVAFLIVLSGWAGSALIGAVAHVSLLTFPTCSAVSGASVGLAAATLLALLLFSTGTAWFVDMNRFSLHGMYRARLVRAYLAASRPAGERDPNPFTGFDDQDNLYIRNLWPRPGTPWNRYDGRPLHIVNVALNLVGGKNLAWQERKAESFTFSPLHCGAHNHGYRPTWSAYIDEKQPGAEPEGYGGVRGPTLGTAMTISGAAVSPNMGYHSSPVISFLLALFNVRLGAWLGNPGHAGNKVYRERAPQSSLTLTFAELFGLTDDKHPYVYLSDGGHFENLGLYEMVLRRCHTIVLSDGGSDPRCTFDDLGNAVRKIRIDFGIPIEFTSVEIHPRIDGAPAQAGRYCAVATIGYSCVDKDAEDGRLIYIKPAFYGSEPRDVYNYAMANPAFPHESTGDQFFSESQFESYRALGSHIIQQILPQARPTPDPFSEPPIAWFVDQVGAYLRASLRPATTAPG